MKAYRIVLTSWTASFRCPNIISGVQLSLNSPPLSTIYGILSASTGEYITPDICSVAYCFRHTSKAFDLEAIQKHELNKKTGYPTNKITADIVKRQLLFDNVLIIYLFDEFIAKSFENPFFSLLLGRSSDLATVESIDLIDIRKKKNLNLHGTVFPMKISSAFGQIQALPTHFTDSIPRESLNIQPFSVIDSQGEWISNDNNYLDFSNWKWNKEPAYIENVEGYKDEETALELWFNE
jgi:CRISPR-associated protein Cas5t